MPGPSNSYRRRRSALLAGSTAAVVAALGGATSIATSLLPGTWAWTHDSAIMWGIVGVLLALAVVLAMIGARNGSEYVGGAVGSQITSNVLLFVGQGAPASISTLGSLGGRAHEAGQS